MTIQECKNHFSEALKQIYPTTEIQAFFNLLVEHRLGMTRIQVALDPAFEIATSDFEFFSTALDSLKKQVPIQYIIGETEFFGLKFKVDANVLIPRPETEELVEWILKDCDPNRELKILDIGTGSGCIPISLAKNLPNAKVFAIDISKGAIHIAKQNATQNKVDVTFIETDILKAASLPDTYDIIVSNPPYVRNLEKQEIKENVLENEPHLALFVEDDDALIFYNKISNLALKHLKQSGGLYFEINQYLGPETSDLVKSIGFDHVILRKDIFEADRMLKATFK